ncbi:MAG: serine hydrolase [Mucilaginibacter polytrichastri]|nr:serine hydrolase [Mucilaginibacter polytrichastri]
MENNRRTLLFCVCIALLSTVQAACGQNKQQATRTAQTYLEQEREAAKTVTLLNNQGNPLPIRKLTDRHFVSIDLGYERAGVFDSLLRKYAPVKSISFTRYPLTETLDDLSDDVKLANFLIVQVTDELLNETRVVDFIKRAGRDKNMIVALFGSGSALAKLDSLNHPIIWSEKNSVASTAYAAQIIFGGVPALAKLPAAFSPYYKQNDGFTTIPLRLKYTVPEDAGIASGNLLKIDEIANQCVNEQAAPGCVVLVAKDGKVIFNKAYGSHTYDKKIPERIDDIFDLASVTKISATTMEVMKLYDEKKLSLDTTFGAFVARARKTDKADIKLRELLTHQAGLTPFIPFYKEIKPIDFSRDSSAAFPTKAADRFYMRKNYFRDVMWPQMLKSSLKTRGKYVYSDLSMYYTKEMIETLTETPLDKYVDTAFYEPLGMQFATFLPRNKFPKERIVPTEDDKTFRMTLLEGYVHDQGAAMVGGVSGHAGLFATANDLAILYQMVLNHGSYGGTQYFKAETVDTFTTRQSSVSRRGLGFDRWDPDESKKYPSAMASPQTYGHTGYTGTCVWVDPKYNLVYIFLSNRVNPAVSNKLSDLNIRPKIQDAIYEAIAKGIK